MSRTTHRFFSSSLRSSVRTNLNAAARSSRAVVARRTMSSELHTGHRSIPSDRTWIIGSALVFGPLFLYLVSPSARKGSHGHTDHTHQNHQDEHEVKYAQHEKSHHEEDVKPIADDEGTEISGQEVKASIERAFDADSPKEAQEMEEAVVKVAAVEANLATESHPNAESSTDAMPETESEPNPPPAAPARIDEATTATNDEKVDGAASNSSASAIESKV